MHVPRRLTWLLAALMAVQSLTGLTASAQYRDADWIAAAWFGNDWLTLVVAVPLVVASGRAAWRGSRRAYLLWLGAIGYAIYNYAFYLLGASLNVFFPLYVVLVVLSTVMLIVTLARLDPMFLAQSPRRVSLARPVASAFVLIGTGLAVVWLAMWAAYVFAGRPTPIDADAFRLVAALDLSLMVPALIAGGVLLWQHEPWGEIVAAVAGVQGSLYLAVLSVNSVVAIHRGLATAPGELLVWAPLWALTTATTTLLLSNVSASGPLEADRP